MLFTCYIYNYKNGDFLRKITFEKEGPNSSPQTTGFLIYNFDSIFTFSYSTGKVKLFNKDIECSKTFMTKQFLGRYINEEYPIIKIETVCSAFVIDNDFHAIGYFKGLNNIPIHIRINLKTNSMSYYSGFYIAYSVINNCYFYHFGSS